MTCSMKPPVNWLTRTMIATMLLFGILFTLWPQLDLATSALFFTGDRSFSGNSDLFVLILYSGVPILSRAVIVGLFIAFLACCLRLDGQSRRRRIQIGYLLVSLALGPGLLIDAVLKDHWGRARPAKVMEFGGSSTFSPALQPTNQCDTNCSFVSGHASAGFYLVSLGFLGGAAARRRWTLIGLGAGSLFGFARITQGGHFLSDVVFSFYATWFAAWLAWRLFVKLGWLAESGPADRGCEAGGAVQP